VRISSIFILIQNTRTPLCRVVPVLTHEKDLVTSCDKEKYRDLLLDAAETVLGYFGFDANVYRNLRTDRSGAANRRNDIEVERDD
jgi:hypothetical protein